MDVKQIATMTNTVVGEILGETAIVNEDLSNIVDVGAQIFDANAVDPFSKALVNQIGKMVFVNRKYAGGVPSVLMDGWEWGSVLAKVSADLPEASTNDSFDLVDGQTYDPNVFYGSVVNEKFYNKRVTFQIAKSFTEMQLKQSFTSKDQYNGFISMLYTSIENAMTVRIEALIMETINGGMGEAIHGGKVVDLLKAYNHTKGTNLTPDVAIVTDDFIRFCAYQIGLYAERMTRLSVNFNVGGKERFTPADRRHTVLLADFAKAIGPYTLAGTFNKEEIALPSFETVPFWQGNDAGSYDLDEVSKIDIKLPSDGTTTVQQSYIIGCIFDHDTLGVTNLDRRVTTNYNPRAEFFNNWYKFDAGYFLDLNENMLVFTISGT